MAEDFVRRAEESVATPGTVPKPSDLAQEAEPDGPSDQVAPSAPSESDVVPYSSRPSYARRTRKPRSALQTILELTTGGLAGTLVAYYGLAWYQGPSFDLPKFGLPWIERMTAAPPKPAVPAKSEGDAKKPGAKNGNGEKSKKPGDPPRNPSASPAAPRASSKDK